MAGTLLGGQFEGARSGLPTRSRKKYRADRERGTCDTTAIGARLLRRRWAPSASLVQDDLADGVLRLTCWDGM